MLDQAKKIRAFILRAVKKHPTDIVAVTTKHFDITRTTAHRHLTTLINERKIIKSGVTRNIKYYPTSTINREFTYKITKQLNEFNVATEDFEEVFNKLSNQIEDICFYGFTEMFNNAIDHSQGSKIIASTEWGDNYIRITIIDNGIGVFKNVSDYFHLDDIRESILQLSKGKMTTYPSDHTGEGIFFSSRAFDVFEIYANDLHYYRDNREDDWGLNSIETANFGSKVVMTIFADSQKNLTNLFKEYQDEESLAFDRTDILVELSRIGEERLISRSQAKRILRNLEKFHRVTLDFAGVRLVGQGFADEIFRVFANKNKDIIINYINASDDVKFMIERGLATAQLGKKK